MCNGWGKKKIDAKKKDRLCFQSEGIDLAYIYVGYVCVMDGDGGREGCKKGGGHTLGLGV